MNIKVRTEQHIAKRMSRFGMIDDPRPQDHIFVSINDQPEVHVGYIGHKPDAPIALIVNESESLTKAILEAIRQHISDSNRTATVVPSKAQMEELAAEEAAIDDEPETDSVEAIDSSDTDD